MKDQHESSFQQLLDMLKSLDERLPDTRQMQKLLEEEKSELTATMQSVMDLGERMENIESHVQVSQKRVSLEAHEGALNELRQKISTCQAHVDATTDHMLQRSEDERTYQRAQVSALRNEFQVGLEALHGRNNSIQSLIKEQSQKAQDEISLLDHRICSAEDRLCLVEETTSKSAQTPGQVASIADRLRKFEENQVGGQADSKMANLESVQIVDEKGPSIPLQVASIETRLQILESAQTSEHVSSAKTAAEENIHSSRIVTLETRVDELEERILAEVRQIETVTAQIVADARQILIESCSLDIKAKKRFLNEVSEDDDGSTQTGTARSSNYANLEPKDSQEPITQQGAGVAACQMPSGSLQARAKTHSVASSMSGSGGELNYSRVAAETYLSSIPIPALPASVAKPDANDYKVRKQLSEIQSSLTQMRYEIISDQVAPKVEASALEIRKSPSEPSSLLQGIGSQENDGSMRSRPLVALNAEQCRMQSLPSYVRAIPAYPNSASSPSIPTALRCAPGSPVSLQHHNVLLRDSTVKVNHHSSERNISPRPNYVLNSARNTSPRPQTGHL